MELWDGRELGNLLGFDWDCFNWHRLIKITNRTLVVVFLIFRVFFVHNNPEAEA